MHPPTVTRFYFLREHRLHGIVTGIESIKTMASLEDKLDRLLVSFKDAKVGECSIFGVTILTSVFQVALLEWSDAVHNLITVSIHTYERAPQLVSNNTLYISVPRYLWCLRCQWIPQCSAPVCERIPYHVV